MKTTLLTLIRSLTVHGLRLPLNMFPGSELENGVKATISPLPSIKLLQGQELKFHSAVPVTGDDHSYIALLHPISPLFDNQTAVQEIKKADLWCGEPGQEAQALDIHGYETDTAYKRYLVFRCKVPFLSQSKTCHTVVLRQKNANEIQIQTCQKDILAANSKPVKLAACVKPLYNEVNQVQRSGLLKLPQWMEYNAIHGVEHFLIYTFKQFSQESKYMRKMAAPYIEKGMASIIEIDVPFKHQDIFESAHNFVINDCLYRMMHKTEWLMPSIDVDEYVTWPGFEPTTSFHSKLNEIRPEVHSVSFGRFTFQLVDPLRGMLDVSSTLREKQLAPLCPKYIVRPDNVHTLFIHWVSSPISGAIGLASAELVGFHYRALANEMCQQASCTVKDLSLAQHTKSLNEHIIGTYHLPVKALFSDIWNNAGFALEKSFTNANGHTKHSNEVLLAKEFPDFVLKMQSLEGNAVIEAPKENERAH